MIIADVGTVYVKLLMVIYKKHENSGFIIFKDNFPNFEYIKKEHLIELEKNYLISLSFNKNKSQFDESFDIKMIKKFIEIEMLEMIHICCKKTQFIEELFFKMFNLKLAKRIENTNTTNLNILGIDFLSKVIIKDFYDIPGQEIVNLNKVGHVLKEVTIKNYVSLKENSLYPFLLANIAEGLSLYRIDSKDDFKRVGGKFF